MMASRLRGLVTRAVIAIALLVGFYLFAIIIAGVLLYIAYLTLCSQVVFYKITFLCLALACTIIWSIIPRRERFYSPGPQVYAHQHPRLFNLLQDVATKTQEKFPAEIYISAEMNAGVSERGGFLGIGGKRIMILGLPLLQVLSVAELRAVLVHEFGHYYSGDTKLASWIYKTRSSIARTMLNLGEGITHLLFRCYGQLFLRITLGIARHQEFAADELAARMEGGATLASALREIYTMSLVYKVYWRDEIVPVLNAGYLPPYIGGFQHFLQSTNVQAVIAAQEEAAATTDGDPYATHPSLMERLKEIERFKEEIVQEDIPAISLIDDLHLLEKSLFAGLGGEVGKNLMSLAWEDVGEKVYLPLYSSLVSKYGAALAGITFEDIRDIARNPQELSQKIGRLEESPLPAEQLIGRTRFVLGAAATVTLSQTGWRICALPGEPVKLIINGVEFAPFDAINRLFAKELTLMDWRELCQGLGIYETVLG